MTALCIDELNGWLLCGQTSGTLNAWKLPTAPRSDSEAEGRWRSRRVFECRNLLESEEDGIRAIFVAQSAVCCVVGYRRMCCFRDYDPLSAVRRNLGMEELFVFSPFTSPHLFYSTQSADDGGRFLFVFCRGFGGALRIDLEAQSTEMLPIAVHNKLPSKANVLGANRHFVVWQTAKSPSNFYQEEAQKHRNKPAKAPARGPRWWRRRRNRVQPPTMKKLSVRSLENLNEIHRADYFEPFPFNAWGFQMDTASMTMAYVVESNLVRIVEVEADWNRMQYGPDYAKSGHSESPQSGPVAASHDLTAALTLNPATSSYEEEIVDSETSATAEVTDRLTAPRRPLERGPKTLRSLSGHSGFILAMEYSDGIVVTLGSDRTVNVWSGHSGRRMASVSNVPGTFIPGNPYIVKRAKKENHKVFYTADDGIFMVVF